jgi:SPASM domain peptide maturase of grasp-with-spasm system
LVKGIERSAIYDIQRENIEFVPNTMIDFLEYINGKKVNSVLKEYGANATAKEYFNFLEKKEFIFYSDNAFFPSLPEKSINDDTSEIFFVTIILSPFIYDNFDILARNIEQLGVKRLHFHINNENAMEEIRKILSSLGYSRVTNLSFSLPYQKIDRKIYENGRLKSIFMFNSPKKRFKKNKEVITNYITNNASNLFLTKFNISDIAINIGAYNIAKNYNLALYKTIFVDENGNIKHNFSEKKTYGNILESFDKIKTNTIKKLSKLWNIKKDEIQPCNVCEFRYCCTTAFTPIKSKDGYEVICNYNPYNAELN